MSPRPHCKILCLFLFGALTVTLFVMYNKGLPPPMAAPIPSDRPSIPQTSDAGSQTSKDRSTKTVEEESGPITVLLWSWPFRIPFSLGDCKALFNISDCHITLDKNVYDKADGVMFHHRDIARDLSNLPKTRSTQKWIWWNQEPPKPPYSMFHKGMENLFNGTCTYRRDSDIWIPYATVVPRDQEEPFELPTKDKLVCWISSNGRETLAREIYYKELRKHIYVHKYGRAADGKHLPDWQYDGIVRSCKFYLSFENNNFTDYITEKLWNPLILGTVPVALGTTRKNYEEFIQGDAFIHVDDFASPKELADHLKRLDNDDELYIKYFVWKRSFKVKKQVIWLEHVCKTCDWLRRHKGNREFHELGKWYWKEDLSVIDIDYDYD